MSGKFRESGPALQGSKILGPVEPYFIACAKAKLRLSQIFWACSDPLESREFAHVEFDDLIVRN